MPSLWVEPHASKAIHAEESAGSGNSSGAGDVQPIERHPANLETIVFRQPIRLLALVFAMTLLLAACGSDDGDRPVAAGEGASDDAVPGAGTPIPVEPDGGIGDGAEPLPGAEPDDVSGDWHGAELAVTNCPGVEFRRVEASAFSFSVPVEFTDQAPQGVDSEVGQWSTDGIDVFYDYGWYSGPVADLAGADVTAIDYSGIEGDLAVITPTGSPEGAGTVAVFFPEVESGSPPNRLNLTVRFDDAADEIIGRCIVGSIEWTS